MSTSGKRGTIGAVFLDRDGTVIRQVELMHQVKDMSVLPGVSKALKLLNDRGIPVILVTNQPVVARGISSEEEVSIVHEELKRRLKRKGARIDAIYFCPHHPNATMARYRERCSCRKPEPGMILLAAKEHGIDLKYSVMIGDTTQDIEAGHRAGVRTILVQTGHGGRDPWQYRSAPDWEAPNLLQAIQIWLAVGQR